jgi:hypothetical protein
MRIAVKGILVVLLAFGFVLPRASAQVEQAGSEAAASEGEADVAVSADTGSSQGLDMAAPSGDAMKFRADDIFRFSVDMSSSFTDNRDSLTNGESTVDFVVTPCAAVGLSGRRGQLNLSYAPPLRYRTNPGDYQDSFDVQQALALSGELRVTPELRLRASENAYYTDDPAVDTSRGSIRGNRSYILNYFESGANWTFFRRSNLDIYARHMIKKYDDKVVGANSDEDGLEGGLAVWRQLTKTIGIQAITKLTAHQFNEQGAVDRDTDILLCSLRAEESFTRALRGAVAFGGQQVNYKDASLDSKLGGYGAVELNGDILPVLKLNAVYTHGLSESDVQPYASQAFDELNARVAYSAHSVTLGVSCAYRLSRYDAQAAPEAAGRQAGGDEKTLSAGADAAMKIGPASSIKLAQLYSDVNSDVGYSFTKNTTRLSLMVTF